MRKTVQITLDKKLAEDLDGAVEKLGTTRSAFTRDALRDALAKIDRRELERRHRRGYEEHPVKPGEFDGWEGRRSVISKEALPAILAGPFEERLLSLGVHRSAAVSLFETGSLTLAQGAQLAGLPLEEFVELLDREGVAAVDYPPEEVAEELEAARR